MQSDTAMPPSDEESRQIENALQREPSALLEAHLGEYALIKDGSVLAYYPSKKDADMGGASLGDSSAYSVLHITSIE